jgi:hypothetical protein
VLRHLLICTVRACIGDAGQSENKRKRERNKTELSPVHDISNSLTCSSNNNYFNLLKIGGTLFRRLRGKRRSDRITVAGRVIFGDPFMKKAGDALTSPFDLRPQFKF